MNANKRIAAVIQAARKIGISFPLNFPIKQSGVKFIERSMTQVLADFSVAVLAICENKETFCVLPLVG